LARQLLAAYAQVITASHIHLSEALAADTVTVTIHAQLRPLISAGQKSNREIYQKEALNSVAFLIKL
jgi:hypothetical protein